MTNMKEKNFSGRHPFIDAEPPKGISDSIPITLLAGESIKAELPLAMGSLQLAMSGYLDSAVLTITRTGREKCKVYFWDPNAGFGLEDTLKPLEVLLEAMRHLLASSVDPKHDAAPFCEAAAIREERIRVR